MTAARSEITAWSAERKATDSPRATDCMDSFVGFTMRVHKVLSIINALAAVALLIVLAITTDIGGPGVTPAMIAEASKNTSPELGLDLLTRRIEKEQYRAGVLGWLCYGTLPLFAINAFCWATWRGHPPAD